MILTSWMSQVLPFFSVKVLELIAHIYVPTMAVLVCVVLPTSTTVYLLKNGVVVY